MMRLIFALLAAVLPFATIAAQGNAEPATRTDLFVRPLAEAHQFERGARTGGGALAPQPPAGRTAR
jgi:hypothetical protein